MGPISFYLSFKVEYNRQVRTIKLSQIAYIDKVLAKFYLDKVYSVNTPMKETTPLKQRMDGEASVSKKNNIKK